MYNCAAAYNDVKGGYIQYFTAVYIVCGVALEW